MKSINYKEIDELCRQEIVEVMSDNFEDIDFEQIISC